MVQIKSEFISISDNLFLRLGKLITEKYGLKMTSEKKILFQARLQKRLNELKLTSFDDYAELLMNQATASDELQVIANYISTNKTEFFRESEHFEFLTNQVLHTLTGKKSDHLLTVWSAGCSSGQEAWSIAITIEEYKRQNNAGIGYSILATDISERMLRIARNAVYPIGQVKDISMDIKRLYFLKSKNHEDAKVRLVKDLRDKVRVAYLNLNESLDEITSDFDIIFLRNTLIYFEPDTQRRILSNVVAHLKPNGFLFIGHSESLINLDLPIAPVSPSVYRKTQE